VLTAARLGPLAPSRDLSTIYGFYPRNPAIDHRSSWDISSASSSSIPAPRFGIAHSPSCPAHPAQASASASASTSTSTSASTPRYPAARNTLRPDLSFPPLPTSTTLHTIPPARANPSTTATDELPQLPQLPFPTLPTPRLSTTSNWQSLNSDDYYLNEIATRVFSTPSIFGEDIHDHNANSVSPAARVASTPTARTTSNSSDESRGSGTNSGITGDPPPGNSRPSSREGDDFDMSTTPTWPRVRRNPGIGGQATPGDGGSSSARARRPSNQAGLPESTTAPRKRKHDEALKSEDGLDDLFGDQDLKVIDLVNTEEVPSSIAKSKPRNEVRLSALQCVICMDDVTNLTVTHCGRCQLVALTKRMWLTVCV